jgi:hypothetical protein
MNVIEEYTKGVNAKIVGGWLITRWKEYGAWQIESRTAFDVYIENMRYGQFDEVLADIRSTELEAWQLAKEQRNESMLDSITRYTDDIRFIESKINSLTSVEPDTRSSVESLGSDASAG